jgi:hypothetical protein
MSSTHFINFWLEVGVMIEENFNEITCYDTYEWAEMAEQYGDKEYKFLSG